MRMASASNNRSSSVTEKCMLFHSKNYKSMAYQSQLMLEFNGSVKRPGSLYLLALPSSACWSVHSPAPDGKVAIFGSYLNVTMSSERRGHISRVSSHYPEARSQLSFMPQWLDL